MSWEGGNYEDAIVISDRLVREAVADHDRVFEVAALPAHERDQHVLAERELARVGRAAVGERLVDLDAVADLDDRTLVDARALVGADELLQRGSCAARRRRRSTTMLLGGDAGRRRRRPATGRPGPSRARRAPPCPCRRCGASGSSSGTAWRCMFEPISARLASSCSRNGMSAVATDTICLGETSM